MRWKLFFCSFSASSAVEHSCKVSASSSGYLIIEKSWDLASGLVIDFLISLQKELAIITGGWVQSRRRRAFLYLSILLNVLSFGFILGKSEGLKAILFDGIFRLDILTTAPSESIVTPRGHHCHHTRQLMGISDCETSAIHLAWSAWMQHELVAFKGIDCRWQCCI